MKIKLTEKTIAAVTRPPDRAQIIAWDEELAGFGVVVGKTARTFVVDYRAGGQKRRAVVGRHGQVRDDGHLWTVQLARKRAQELLGQVAGGGDPQGERRAQRDGVTLREGLELHVADMRKRNCSARSIDTIEYEIPKYLDKWIDRPLTELTGLDLHELHSAMSKTPFLANRVIAEVSAIWNTVDRIHELEGRNPASRVRRNKLPPKRERIDDKDFAAWWAKAQTLTPVRRDLQTFLLFTGLRSADARSVRWADVDLKARALHRPAPKGGEAKAFTLPLCQTIVKLLKRRQKENAEAFKLYGGDHGLVFPSLSRNAPYRVIPVAEPKERRWDENREHREQFLPGPHVLRRTYISVGREIGIPEIDMHALANHSFAAAKVQDQYVRQAFDHLADCQARIEAALWKRIKAKTPARAAA